MIYIVDYEAGNLRSVQKAVEFVGAKAEITSDPNHIRNADKVIFPGVGAFGNAIEKIDAMGLRQPLVDYINSGRPFLGICLGMQLLFDHSEENPAVKGLGVFKGPVIRFPKNLKVPHLGWNLLIQTQSSPLWADLPDESYFYFAHSFYISPENKAIITGETDYFGQVPIAVRKNNVFGLQFHPEKSQKNGLQILSNYIKL